jgi:hypothetical protein
MLNSAPGTLIKNTKNKNKYKVNINKDNFFNILHLTSPTVTPPKCFGLLFTSFLFYQSEKLIKCY